MNIISFLLFATLPMNARADDYHFAIIFDTGYVNGPSEWEPWDNFPTIGDPLQIVGHVLDFNAPFEGLLPTNGSYEVTYSFYGFHCESYGMWDDFENSAGGAFALFEGGSIGIYLDTTPDASFSDKSTFENGELLLEAKAFYLNLSTRSHVQPAQQGYYYFTGGTWYHLVNDNGSGNMLENLGDFTEEISDAMKLLGFIGQSTTRIDVFEKVPYENTTWGRIKAIYGGD